MDSRLTEGSTPASQTCSCFPLYSHALLCLLWLSAHHLPHLALWLRARNVLLCLHRSMVHHFSDSPLSLSKVLKLLTGGHPTTCVLDPIPSNLLTAISHTKVPATTRDKCFSGFKNTSDQKAFTRPCSSIKYFFTSVLILGYQKVKNTILSLYIAGFISSLQHGDPLLPAVCTLQYWHLRPSAFLVWILSKWTFHQYIMARTYNLILSLPTRGAPRLSAGAPFLQYTQSPLVQLSTHMVSHITAMQMTSNYTYQTRKVTKLSQYQSLLFCQRSMWLKELYLQLKLSKTELLVILANQSLHHNINIKSLLHFFP